jgi:hypothetical protein
MLVEDRLLDAGLEPDVATQVETIGDVLGVGEDLRLRRVPLGPLPLLLEPVVEAVGVLEALHVTAGARIPVPVPGTPDSGTAFEHLDLEPE